MRKYNTLLPYAALLAAAIIWGGSFVVLKNSLDSLGPNTILSIRYILASVFLCLIFKKRLKQISIVSVKRGLFIGVLIYAGSIIGTFGVLYTTAGKAAFLTTIYVVAAPFVNWLVAKIRPKLYNIAATIVCITGVGLLSLTSSFTVGIGDTLCVISGIIYAFHIVYIGIYLKSEDIFVITTLQLVFAAVFATIAALLTERLPANPFEPGIVISMLFLGIVATSVALLFQFWAQRYIPPARTSILLSTESVFGCISGIIFLSESMTARMIAGSALIFFAVIISETKLKTLLEIKPLQRRRN